MGTLQPFKDDLQDDPQTIVEEEIEENADEIQSSFISSVLKVFEAEELDNMINTLKSQGIDLSQNDSNAETRSVYSGNYTVEVVKLSCKTPHPANKGTIASTYFHFYK